MENILKKIKDLHYDIHQLEIKTMDDLNIDCYNKDYPMFYDFMESFDGNWSIEIIETKPEYEDIILFHDLGKNKIHYYEENYNNPIKFMRGNKYTYIQNDSKSWLICLNEKEVKKDILKEKTMYCLYCGDCCLRMSPKSNSYDGLNKSPCPDLINIKNYYFCADYKNRPKECANHDFPSNFCPIGLTKLNIDKDDLDTLRNRIDYGWELINDVF